MAKTISILLQKGGSAKTSTSLCFCAFAGKRKRKILLIDMDSQANATFASGIEDFNYSVRDVLLGKCDVKQAIQKCKYYDMLPANIDVRDLAGELTDIYALKKALEPIQGDYDYIVIDNPPMINAITINSLVASDTMIIPIEPKPFSFMGMSDLLDTINEIHSLHWNDNLSVLGILLTRYNTRTKLNERMEELIKENAERLNTTLFDCSIRECTVIPVCQEKQIALPDYKPSKNNAAMDYNGFVTKALQRLESEK